MPPLDLFEQSLPSPCCGPYMPLIIAGCYVVQYIFHCQRCTTVIQNFRKLSVLPASSVWFYVGTNSQHVMCQWQCPGLYRCNELTNVKNKKKTEKLYFFVLYISLQFQVKINCHNIICTLKRCFVWERCSGILKLDYLRRILLCTYICFLAVILLGKLF